MLQAGLTVGCFGRRFLLDTKSENALAQVYAICPGSRENLLLLWWGLIWGWRNGSQRTFENWDGFRRVSASPKFSAKMDFVQPSGVAGACSPQVQTRERLAPLLFYPPDPRHVGSAGWRA